MDRWTKGPMDQWTNGTIDQLRAPVGANNRDGRTVEQGNFWSRIGLGL